MQNLPGFRHNLLRLFKLYMMRVLELLGRKFKHKEWIEYFAEWLGGERPAAILLMYRRCNQFILGQSRRHAKLQTRMVEAQRPSSARPQDKDCEDKHAHTRF